jgi:hypothetical protein
MLVQGVADYAIFLLDPQPWMNCREWTTRSKLSRTQAHIAPHIPTPAALKMSREAGRAR